MSSLHAMTVDTDFYKKWEVCNAKFYENYLVTLCNVTIARLLRELFILILNVIFCFYQVISMNP